jgi:hypothetical protein
VPLPPALQPDALTDSRRKKRRLLLLQRDDCIERIARRAGSIAFI